MIVGTQVQSHEAPGATGTVTRRVDDDSGVTLLVNWTLCDGRTVLLWHREDALTPIEKVAQL